MAVLGAGAMGTSLSSIIARNGHIVKLWVRNKDLCEIIKRTKENPKYLPKVKFNSNIYPLSNLEECINDVKIIIFAIPSHAIREVSKIVSKYDYNDTVALSVAKGIEFPSLKRMTEIISEEMRGIRVAVMSGPNFATELANDVPSTTVIASPYDDINILLKSLLYSNSLIIETTKDIIGVELCGIIKNILAIAIGIVDGINSGHNTRGMIMTWGFKEMIQICVSQGAKIDTILGPAGVGDMITTSFSDKSRNRMLGYMLTQKNIGFQTNNERLGPLTEGRKSVLAIREMALKRDIPIYLIEFVHQVIYKNVEPRKALKIIINQYRACTHC